MIEHLYAPATLLTMRCACHLLIALRIFAYKPRSHRCHRHVVGLVAAIFAGLNMMEFLHIVTNFHSEAPAFEPYLTGVMLFLLLFVTWTGGNVAKFMPQKLIQRLP